MSKPLPKAGSSARPTRARSVDIGYRDAAARIDEIEAFLADAGVLGVAPLRRVR